MKTLVPENMVTLIDGRQVSTNSAAWAHQTLAQFILDLPTLAMRRDWLYGTIGKDGRASGGMLQKRGEVAVKRMEETMLALWQAREAQREAA